MHGDDAVWGIHEHLLASAVDALRVANWQRSADGAKGRNYPEPIPRPGVKPSGTQIGSEPLTLDDMADWLGWRDERGD